MSIDSDVSNSKLIFLIDTEASVSLLRVNSTTKTINCNKNDIITLTGITTEPIHTLGSCNVNLRFNGINLMHKFHVVSEKFPIPAHGIIGKDFIKLNKCLIDYGQMNLTIRTKNDSIIVPIQSEMLNGLSVLPPRCESFKVFHIKSESFPCVIESQMISENVFIPTTISNSENCWIRVLNTNDEYKLISTDTIESKPLSNFDIFKLNIDTSKTKSNEKVETLRQILNAKVPDHAKAKLMPLCIEFSDIFQLESDKSTVNNFYQQELNVQDNFPVYNKNYRLPQSQKIEINDQVQKLLKNDLIEICTSNYNSPLIVVPKKSIDGNRKWRMCVDYRALNRKLIPDKFPLPRIDEILDGLGNAKYFSVVDLYSGYHQIPITENSRKYTAFTADIGHYQWKVLPFGLNIAPASFMRMMTLAFSGLTPEKCFIYMDDVIVIGLNENNHINNLRKIFEVCGKFNLKLNPQKCEFFKTEIAFLGHKCTSNGLLPDPYKIQCVKNYPVPKNKDEAKRFVAFANYYRRFIENFSGLTRCITKLTGKRVDFVWTKQCQVAFDTVKQKLMSPQILAYPDFSKPFKITVDASHLAVGAVLTQNHNGFDRPIAFISRTFKKGELNKAIIEKELIAIHFAITTFRPYVYGNKFEVLTDHKPLIYLYSLKNPTSRLARMRLDLEEYNYSISHISGKDNVVADALSRIEIEDLKNVYEEYPIFKFELQRNSKNDASLIKTRNSNSILAITRSMSRNVQNVQNAPHQMNDEIIQNTIKVTENLTAGFNHKIPRVRVIDVKYSADTNQFTQLTIAITHKHKKLCSFTIMNEKLSLTMMFSQLEHEARTHKFSLIQWPLHDKIFSICNIENFKKIANKVLKTLQIELVNTPTTITNNSEKVEIMNKFHTDKLYGAHCGQKKLYAKLRGNYYWKNMTRDIKKFVNNCKSCKLSKPNQLIKEQMTLTNTPQKPFDCVQIDTIGPLSKTFTGKQYAVTIICDLTKYLVTIAVENKSAAEVAKAIFENFILIYGPMKSIRTDMGTEYRNSLIKSLCDLMNVEHNISTAHHHESLGVIERNHRVFNEYIRNYLEGNMSIWDAYLRYFTFAYNIQKNSSNDEKYSPYELVFARRPNLPHEILNGRVDPIYNVDDYVKEARYKLQKAHNHAKSIIDKIKLRSKTNYDRSCYELNVKVGDLIKFKKEPYNKFDRIYDGPFEIMAIEQPNIIIKLENDKLYKIHKNRVQLY